MIQEHKYNVIFRQNIIVKVFIVILFLCLSIYNQSIFSQSVVSENTYNILTIQNGLSDNRVWQILQLSDGRMLFVTPKGVDIYDGQNFSHISRDNDKWMPLPLYKGYTSLYIDSKDRLWIKDQEKVCCKDLRTLNDVVDLEAILRCNGVMDIFIDSNYEIWMVTQEGIINNTTGITLNMDKLDTDILLQDIGLIESILYAFFDDGSVVAFDVHTGKYLYSVRAYDKSEAETLKKTSIIVKAPDNNFFQMRMGDSHSVLLLFDTKAKSFKKIYECDFTLHTPIVTPKNIGYVTCPEGYIVFDLNTGQITHKKVLQLSDGTKIGTGYNTAYQDMAGGLWLGSYAEGVLYSSPLSGLFDTNPIDIDIVPILSNIYLRGTPLQVGEEYGGKILLPMTPPYIKTLELNYHQNDIAFQFTTMNYIRPRDTYYKYSFNGGKWHEVSASSAKNVVNDKGMMHLSFTNLKPGSYELHVMASTNPHSFNGTMRTIEFIIHSPWWLSCWALCVWSALLLFTIFWGWKSYRRYRQKIWEQKIREQSLIEKLHELMKISDKVSNSENMALSENNNSADEQKLSAQDNEFVRRATNFVNHHLADSSYGVEQLALDMCMDRTGLYKKMTAIMNNSPVAFIRNIRLYFAAQLLEQGDKSIAEIAEITGFSSSSYFSKCFQKEFGCRPSDYQKNRL